MSNDSERIAELEAELQRLKAQAPATAARPLEPAVVPAPQGAADVSGTLRGNAIGVNNGTVQAFFGGAPGEPAELLLADYLDSLIGECQELRLYRLTGRRQTGAEQRAAPLLRLQAVYTSLMTDGPAVVVHRRERTGAQIRKLLPRLNLDACSPDVRPPERVRQVRVEANETLGRKIRNQIAHLPLDELPDDMPVRFELIRPELALESIHTNPRLVLLGEPGFGKTTVLRYLALLLALRLRGASVDLPGWPIDRLPVPILCPLGQVAAAMPAHAGDADAALWQVLGDILEGPRGLRAGLRAHLTPALRRDGVLLLFDGLDELPAVSAAGDPGARPRVAAALRRFAAQTQVRIVVTSRVLPYRSPGDWKLSGEQVWHERSIQPLAFGQVCTFVGSWYEALTSTDPVLDHDAAAQRAQALIDELASNERLRPLVRSPLLLTMLAILHYNTDEVPRDRARLYDECVQLLLERWEPVRTPGLDRPGLLERLGNLPGVEIDLLRNVIHELAFLAHNRPPADDGRGFLDGPALEGKLLRFFRNAGSPTPDAALQVFLSVLREDAGLLQERADDHYAFPHLTFQEYLAACYLADQSELSRLAYGCWCGEDRERWREVLLLLAGRLRQQGAKAVERDGLPWLKLLAGRRVGTHDKGATQRRRDAVLAALSYAELGGRAALANSMIDVEAELEAPLAQAIVDLLETADSAIPTADRIAAARVLADLGDPRFPVNLDQWQATCVACNVPLVTRHSPALPFGTAQGSSGVEGSRVTSYWRALPAGTYPIGGWEDGEQSAAIGLSTFWIARFPVTVAQFVPFVARGYGTDAERWWTPNGWRWKQDRRRTQPYLWNEAPYDGPNQPVIGVTWYEATAFCGWLTAQLDEALPKDYVVRLPTEAEWEAAAAYDGAMQRQPYPWGADKPTPERAIYDASGLGRPAPVGCCPSGAAACGAIDMAGNVWEMTTSSYRGYPAQSGTLVKKFTTDAGDMPWRGGSYYSSSTSVRCGARFRSYPDVDDFVGFRVVVAPRSH